MAKILLWFIVILGIIGHFLAHLSGSDIGIFGRIVIFSCLGVLAICESIEKVISKQK